MVAGEKERDEAREVNGSARQLGADPHPDEAPPTSPDQRRPTPSAAVRMGKGEGDNEAREGVREERQEGRLWEERKEGVRTKEGSVREGSGTRGGRGERRRKKNTHTSIGYHNIKPDLKSCLNGPSSFTNTALNNEQPNESSIKTSINRRK